MNNDLELAHIEITKAIAKQFLTKKERDEIYMWSSFLKEFEAYFNYQFKINYMIQYFETVNVNLDIHNYFLKKGYKPFTYKVKVGG